MQPTPPATGQVLSVGLLQAAPVSVLIEEEKAAAQATQNQPLVTGIAAHIRTCWIAARTAKQQTVEPRMLQNIRARRGEYDPEKLADIRKQGGSEVYAMLTSVKCRAAASWLRDILLGQGADRPWTVRPTIIPELPPDIQEQIISQAIEPIKQSIVAGQPMSNADVVEMMGQMRDQALHEIQFRAREASDRMGDKMEDQLLEGGWLQSFDQFLDDITTFPAAILKGPVICKKQTLKWVPGEGGKYEAKIEEAIKEEWRRVDPFKIYPSPAATTVNNGYLIEKHQMSRDDLNALIGVKGYHDSSIRAVIDQYGSGGLKEWLTNDVAQASAEGKSMTAVMQNPDHLIDALQYWGTVSGKMLKDWGMTADQIKDETKEYHVEAWLIGSYVIKAELNFDPLNRKPYYKTSYEEIPGSWWGNSTADLCRDAQTVMNASARGMVNNMGIASGPQVVVNVDRLPPGEDITNLYPWKIWQVTNDPTGNSGAPVMFTNVDSRISEYMAVFEKWSQMADEWTGLPRYLSGETSGGAGRTASGLSMLINNAGKAIKQVVSNIDTHVLSPMLERLYDYNMQFSTDATLKGDVNVVARGANSLIAKDAAQLRRNEFLATTANPFDMQIVGIEGRAALLREAAKNLDMDVDKIVPPDNVLKQRMAMMAQSQAQAAAAQSGGAPQKQGSGQELLDGSPTTDNFQPS